MIITEGSYTDSAFSRGYENQPGLVTEQQIKGWKKATEGIKRHGAAVIAQLMHAGALSQFSEVTMAPSAVQPVGVKMPQYGGSGGFPVPKGMVDEDIECVKKGFITAAKAAVQADFDGVEIHAANGYLLDQFLTPESNLRGDNYGGQIANRFRLIAEIIDGIKGAVPRGFLIGLRLSEGKVNDLEYRWKNGYDDAVELLQQVSMAPVDFIHIAVQSGEWERDSFYSNGASLASVARQITGKPVIANGGLHDLRIARQVLDGGHADLIAIGKAALMPNGRWIWSTWAILFHFTATCFGQRQLSRIPKVL